MRAVHENVECIKVLDEEIFISESLALVLTQQVDSIVSLAALIGYRVEIKKNARRIEVTYKNEESEAKVYTLFLFLTPGKVLSSTYLFNEFGINFHSREIGLLGPLEKLKELL